MRLVNGYQASQAIHVAATLGIADCLKDGSRTSEEVAAAVGAHPPSLYRLLRALASLGIFREDGERRFSLTPLGACLRSDAPQPVGPWAIFVGQRRHWETWDHLLHSVQTGESAFRHLYNTTPWEARASNPEASAVFDQAMTAISLSSAEAVLAAYDFGTFQCVVDVAGGQGALLAAILAKHPAIQGVLFDQPHVVAGAASILEAAGVADRCQVNGGSFFEAVPAGGDAYVLKAILHDWDDGEAAAILRSCRNAIEANGRLLVIEREILSPNEGAPAKLSDLNMLVMLGGRERTRDEYAALFAASGFRLGSVTATESGLSVFEGVPA
jgi:hypothetical protein